MLLRLAITALRPPHTLFKRGLIPVIAHWDLAAFMYHTASSSPGQPVSIEEPKALRAKL